jgi:hypothetical protein
MRVSAVLEPGGVDERSYTIRPLLDSLACPTRAVILDPIPALVAHRDDELLMINDLHLTPKRRRFMVGCSSPPCADEER